MNHRLIFIAILVAIFGCNRPAVHVDTGEQPIATSSQDTVHVRTDFANLLGEIKNCNEKELAYFDQYWGAIHAKLKRAAENGELSGLPLGQQEELWDALSYLQSCRHGSIMREHGGDMVEILFRFGTKEQLTLLREIYPNGAQDAR